MRLSCRRVLAGDGERTGTARWCRICSWRATSGAGERQPGREGDARLRAGGQGRPGRVSPVGVMDLTVPDPEAGRRPATAGGEVEVLDAGGWAGRGYWIGCGNGSGSAPRLRQVAAGRRYDSVAVERVLFALVAQRAVEQGSKLAATRMGGRAGGDRAARGAERRSDLPGDGLSARRVARDGCGSVRLGGAPAEPGSGHRLRGHDVNVLEIETADTDAELADPARTTS